ncbi:MAG: hypothetical protein FWD31_15790 [Planctomycetaceae bacterium]|nr:hypothetical protein [Planctomycetaceae bacterium]
MPKPRSTRLRTRIICPHCHLIVPRTLFEMPLFFLSIVGAPAAAEDSR